MRADLGRRPWEPAAAPAQSDFFLMEHPQEGPKRWLLPPWRSSAACPAPGAAAVGCWGVPLPTTSPACPNPAAWGGCGLVGASAAELVSARTARAVGRDGASPRVRTGPSWLQTRGGSLVLQQRGARRRCVREKQTHRFRLSWALGLVLPGPLGVGATPQVTHSAQGIPHPAPGPRWPVARLAGRQQRGGAAAVGAGPRQRSASRAVSYHIALDFTAQHVPGII